MHTRPSAMPLRPSTLNPLATSTSTRDGVYKEFYDNSSAPRINSDVVRTYFRRSIFPSSDYLSIPPPAGNTDSENIIQSSMQSASNTPHSTSPSFLYTNVTCLTMPQPALQAQPPSMQTTPQSTISNTDNICSRPREWTAVRGIFTTRYNLGNGCTNGRRKSTCSTPLLDPTVPTNPP